MLETLNKLYKERKLTLAQLDNAVSKGWISEEEKKIIINGN